VIDADPFRVAVLIVSFRNPEDVQACLAALAQLTEEPRFDVFVCENGGAGAFRELCERLVAPQGACSPISGGLAEDALITPSGRLTEVKCLALKSRGARVWLGCAADNLGYAGGLNIWIDRLLSSTGWAGIWVLNPDSEPHPRALQALTDRAITGRKGMVGSTIVSSADHNYVYCRAGHRWRKLRTSLAFIGLGEEASALVDLSSIESDLDCIAGGSMYVTRACLEKIGRMDERFFLYYEDADWSMRAKRYGLGYAPNSIVPHKGGTTIGSARLRAERSRLSVYLESRNNLHFVRMHWHRYFPLGLFFGCAYAITYLFALSSKNFRAAAAGLLAAIRGEIGRPKFHG